MFLRSALVLSAAAVLSANAACPPIRSRAAWGAVKPTRPIGNTGPVSYVFIHHTVTPECTTFAACAKSLRNIQAFHIKSKDITTDIGYNFLIGSNGEIYEGRGWGKVGAHTRGYNTKGHAISFIGNFMTKKPTPAALAAAKRLIQCGVETGKIQKTYKLAGHRDAYATACPGNQLYADIQKWARYNKHL